LEQFLAKPKKGATPNITPLSSVNSFISEGEEQMHTDLEPFVDADEIAALIDEPRRNVIRMAREGKLTAYMMSGTQRHTYKFRRSEVIRDIEKLRQPSYLMVLANDRTHT
jgi:hypothetical protein